MSVDLDRVKGYLGSVVEKTGDVFMPEGGEEKCQRSESISSAIMRFLTKTAFMGGVLATSYYLGRDSTKPNGVVSKLLGRNRVNKAKVDGCILHCYDHCPFSIRVELALAFLGVSYKRVLYGYGDVEGPTALCGKKQLPVMEYMRTYTEESLDIIDMVDTNTVHRSIPPKTDRDDLCMWSKEVKTIRQNLCRPRKIKLPIRDWADKRDIRYAKRKWEKQGFNLKEALARTPELLTDINELLEQFNDKILYDEHSVNEFGFGMDDILLIPDLRTLTCVKGIKWPKKVRKYLQNAFENTIADLYFMHAVE